MQINPEEDLVIYKENGVIMSGGYSVESTLLKNNILNQTGGVKHDDDINFKDLAIPIGLLYVVQPCDKKEEIIMNEHNTIPDDIYDKLFEMAQDKKPKKKPRTYKMKPGKEQSKRKTKKTKPTKTVE